MSHLVWKRRVGQWAAQLPSANSRRVVLLYHSLGEQAPALTAQKFAQQIAFLAEHAKLVSLEQLLAPDSAPGLQVALSFDDGYASLHDQVAPLLPAGVGATVYVNTALMGEHSRQRSDASKGHYPHDEFLLWSEVAALQRAGWLIGSHGVEHTDLTAVSSAQADAELRQSRHVIEQRLQQPCRHFAYTWGRFNRSVQQQVRAAGYATAVSCLHGPLTTQSDSYALPRIDVRADYSIEDFAAVVSGHWDFLGYKQRLQRLLQ
jgi:peptidoglycan/xylan/chitin deacetylase (PgdA/CDA1 family)